LAQRSSRAIRYAEAIFQVAHDANTYDNWLRELGEVSFLVSDPQAARVLASPAIPSERKAAILEQALPDLSPQVKRFLALLLRRERLPLVPEVLTRLQDLIDRERGLERIKITTALPLDAEERSLLMVKLATRTGRRVQFEEAVDPSLIGGVVAQIGDQIIDGSVRGRLQRLRRALAGD
jgi:F-type H+-transporting ATPase subunit delta